MVICNHMAIPRHAPSPPPEDDSKNLPLTRLDRLRPTGSLTIPADNDDKYPILGGAALELRASNAALNDWKNA